MTNFLQETVRYGDLVERINDMLAQWAERAKQAAPTRRDALPDGAAYADWMLTLRADPHDKLVAALRAIQSRPAVEQIGLRAERDAGEHSARLLLAGYYAAVGKCILALSGEGVPQDAAAGHWEAALEADTPEAEILDDLVGRLSLYYTLKQSVEAGKSGAR